MTDNYRWLARYNAWFNERLYDACEQVPDAPGAGGQVELGLLGQRADPVLGGRSSLQVTDLLALGEGQGVGAADLR